jgi:hypothetical protein
MDTQDDIKQWLQEQGFSECKNELAYFEDECKWYACKRYPSKYNCECNYDKDGIQVVVTPHKWRINGHQCQSVEINITGEANGIWCKLQAYSLTWAELPDKFDQVTDTLMKAWEAIPRNE